MSKRIKIRERTDYTPEFGNRGEIVAVSRGNAT